VTCSPDSAINKTEILLKVASTIRLVFDYIYLLFVPVTPQIMLLNIRAHAILTICSFSHAPEFCGRLLYLSVCSLALYYCLLFSSRLYFCWKTVSDMYTLRSMYLIFTNWQLFYICCKVQQLKITLLWQWRYKCYFSNSSVPLTFVKTSFSSECSEFSDLSIIAIRI